jgi:hypothetical protein
VGIGSDVTAGFALEEVHICSRFASSNGRPKLQFVATKWTTVRIFIGRLHRARKTRGGSAYLVNRRQAFVITDMAPTVRSRGYSATREQAMADFKAQWLQSP